MRENLYGCSLHSGLPCMSLNTARSTGTPGLS
jgi:hypothetical protein